MTLTQNASLLDSDCIDPDRTDPVFSDSDVGDSDFGDSDFGDSAVLDGDGLDGDGLDCDDFDRDGFDCDRLDFAGDDRAATAVLDSHLPLTSAAALDARVRQLVPTAVTAQVWLILLDADDIQMPVMLPLGGLPQLAPQAGPNAVAELLRSLHSEFEAVTFVFLVERPGAAALSRSDAEGLRLLLLAGREAPFRVRCAYLCHDDGVAAYDLAELDELVFDGAGAVPVP